MKLENRCNMLIYHRQYEFLTSKVNPCAPTSMPSQERTPLRKAINETNAIILAIIPSTSWIAVSAPLVAASKTLHSSLK
jgi:hypothetical protein